MRVSSPFFSGCNVVRAEHVEDTVHEEDVLSQDLTKFSGDRRGVIKPAGFEARLNALGPFQKGSVFRSDLPNDLGRDEVRLRAHDTLRRVPDAALGA